MTDCVQGQWKQEGHDSLRTWLWKEYKHIGNQEIGQGTTGNYGFWNLVEPEQILSWGSVQVFVWTFQRLTGLTTAPGL
jgi:hypothetical protein